MLHNMIMNGKDMDIDEVMQKLEAKNVIKDGWAMFVATHGDN